MNENQNERPEVRLEAPTPIKSEPIDLQTYHLTGANADDTLYRITTVSMNPLTDYETREHESGHHELVVVSPADTPEAYVNVYEMPLWEMSQVLVPWIMRKSGGLRETIIDVERLGRFKGANPEIERR